MQITLPEDVKLIIGTLEKAGHEAYAVGGCVRDSIMGKTPNDWDITTSAEPYEIKRLFRRTVDTGIKHGTVTVILHRTGYEVTTYRLDGEYEDSRHPKEVTFTKSLEEDLKRRDFTVNAMAYNERAGLVDRFDGIGDMERKSIRCVGEAKERFTEDALRMMRAVRFSAQFGYEIEAKTKQAISALAPNLKNISAERIREELLKLLVSPHPDYLRICYETGITGIVLPEFDSLMETEQNNPNHCYSVGEHTLVCLKAVRPEKVLRLAMLFHDIGKPARKTTDENGIDHFKMHAQESADMTAQIMRRLKFDNDTTNKVCRLVKYHDWEISLEKDVKRASIRRMVSRIGEDAFPDMFEVNRADIYAQSEYRREEKLEKLERIEKLYREIQEKRECLSLKSLAVTGSDLIGAGMRPGPELGAVLQRMLEAVLAEPERNTKDYLIEHLKEYTDS